MSAPIHPRMLLTRKGAPLSRWRSFKSPQILSFLFTSVAVENQYATLLMLKRLLAAIPHIPGSRPKASRLMDQPDPEDTLTSDTGDDWNSLLSMWFRSTLAPSQLTRRLR